MPFGNAYYLTETCGGVLAPDPCFNSTDCLYNASARQCFNRRCGRDVSSAPGDCFRAPNGTRLAVQCQNGEVECYANKLQACASHTSLSASWGFSHCMFEAFHEERLVIGYSNHTAIDFVAKSCAEKMALSWPDIANCASTPAGDSAIQEMARLTPAHRSVPYVEINGTAVGTDEASLQAAICALVLEDPLDLCSTNPPPSSEGGLDAGGITGIVLACVGLVFVASRAAHSSYFWRKWRRRAGDPLLGSSTEYGFLASPIANVDD